MSYSTEVTALKIESVRAGRRVNPLRTAPNLLTLCRICLLPFLVMAVLERRFLLGFALFLVAAITDAMDGLIARWLEQRTLIGQYLDPIADKLLLSSLFLVLTYMGVLRPHVAAIVFSRDLGMLVVAAILYAMTDLRDFHPTFLGKANSFSQVVAIGVVLFSLVPDMTWDQPWVIILRAAALNTTIALTVISGFHYGWVVSQRVGGATGPPGGAAGAVTRTAGAQTTATRTTGARTTGTRTTGLGGSAGD